MKPIDPATPHCRGCRDRNGRRQDAARAIDTGVAEDVSKHLDKKHWPRALFIARLRAVVPAIGANSASGRDYRNVISV